MNDKKPVWVILTDGYFIRIMFKKDSASGLHTLRDGDFEHTSDITYNLVTGKRNQDNSETWAKYFLGVLGTFLSEQDQKNSFEKLVIVAPDNVLKKLLDALPESVRDKVAATVARDYLAESRDNLEKYLADHITS